MVYVKTESTVFVRLRKLGEIRNIEEMSEWTTAIRKGEDQGKKVREEGSSNLLAPTMTSPPPYRIPLESSWESLQGHQLQVLPEMVKGTGEPEPGEMVREVRNRGNLLAPKLIPPPPPTHRIPLESREFLQGRQLQVLQEDSKWSPGLHHSLRHCNIAKRFG